MSALNLDPAAPSPRIKRRLDLMPDGPLARIDRALGLVRQGGLGPVLWAVTAGSIPALAVLLAFWLERVEGVFELRLGIAAALIASFAMRAVLLSEVSRTYVRGLWDAVDIPPDAGRPIAVMRTAAWVSAGLALWSTLLLSTTLLGPFAVAFAYLFLSLRAFTAPGWLARVACTNESGMRALRGAILDNSAQRGENLAVEFLLSVGALGLALNLMLAATFGFLILRSFLGIELALLDQFLSTRNPFAMVGAALLALVMLEPLRAALSAIVYVDARVRGEGLDVRASIESAIEHASKARGANRSINRPKDGASSAAAALLLCGALLGSSPGLAQDGGDIPADGAPPTLDNPALDHPPLDHLSTGPHATPEALEHDSDVRLRAERILARPEYREFSDSRARGLRDLIARWLADLFGGDPDESDTSTPGLGLPLPGPGVFIALGVLLVMVVVPYLLLSRERPLGSPTAQKKDTPKAEDPRDQAPEAWVDAASKLAAQGRYREALRALYLATLVALDRRQAITFDPTLTNWQYLRQLAGNSMRSDFRELTRIFDHKWYGHEDTAEVDYQVCRQLAERLLARAARIESQAEAPEASS